MWRVYFNAQQIDDPERLELREDGTTEIHLAEAVVPTHEPVLVFVWTPPSPGRRIPRDPRHH